MDRGRAPNGIGHLMILGGDKGSGQSWKSCRSWSEFWEIQTLICKEMCKKFLVQTKICRSLTDRPALSRVNTIHDATQRD